MKKKSQEEEHYVIIDGRKIIISNEIEKELLKSIGRERNRARQKHSCGQNDFHKCLGDCLFCSWNRIGTILPMEAFSHEYFANMASDEDIEQTVFQKIIVTEIYAFANRTVPHGAELLFKRFDEQKSLRIIALEMDLQLTIVARRLNLLIQLLRNNQEKFF